MIAPHELEALKRNACDPRTVCEALGLLVDGKGRGWVLQPSGGILVRCPWHADNGPSCSVRIGKDGTLAAHCFACQKGGDVFALVAAVYGLGRFPDVAEAVGRLVGHALAPPGRSARVPARPAEALDPVSFHNLVDRLGALCPIGSEGRAYLEARRIYADAQAVGVFELPSATEQAALIRALRETFSDEALALSGLFGSRGFAWDSHRLAIPWRDDGGAIETLQRRPMRNARKGEPKYVFPPGRRPTHPFGAEHYAEAIACIVEGGAVPEVIFTEGAFDALARRKLARDSRQASVVLGIPSASDLRPQWSRYVDNRHVVIAFDADTAGDSAVERFRCTACCGARSISQERPVGANDVNGVLASC